jgi:hypothetical protein
MAFDADGNPIPAGIPTGPAAQTGAGAPRLFTQEEVNAERERIRKEEHDKLYPDLQSWKSKAEAFEAEKTAREAAAAEAAANAAKEAERARIADLSAKEQLAEYQAKMERELEQERQARLATEQLWQKEQQFSALRLYRQQVLDSCKDDIFPEWWDDLVGPEGDFLTSTAEIDARAATLVKRTQAVLSNVTSQQDEQRRATPTASTNTGAPSGYDPTSDPNITHQGKTFTAEEIAGMSLADYAKNRQYLPTGRSGAVKSRGLFG